MNLLLVTAQKKTRLVIVDCVLMHACREYDQSGEYGQNSLQMPQAPAPLIPNWGAANALAYKFDLLVRRHFSFKSLYFYSRHLLIHFNKIILNRSLTDLFLLTCLQMLSNHNACERTYAQLNALLTQAGWRISSDRPIYAPKGSWLAAVVAEPGPLPADILPSPTRLASSVSQAYEEARPSWSADIEEVPILLDSLQLVTEEGRGGDSGSLQQDLEKEPDRSPTLVGSPTHRSSRWPWTLKTRNNRLIEAPSVSDTMISISQENAIGKEKSKLSQGGISDHGVGKGWCEGPLERSEDSGLADDIREQENSEDVQNAGKTKEIGKRRSLWFTFKSGSRTPRSRRAELPRSEMESIP